jgi:nicotinate phosphoribosyltransferase
MFRQCGGAFIIESLLDVDFYKLTMGQFAYLNNRETQVTYKLINRTSNVRLAEHIDMRRLQNELDHVRTLSFTIWEINYLRKLMCGDKPMFCERYLNFLFRELRLPEPKVSVVDGQPVVEVSGPWAMVIFWETIILSIVTELYGESQISKRTQFLAEAARAEGIVLLAEKISILESHPEVVFCDFGTRRRFSAAWQRYVVRSLQQHFGSSQFLGTSNTLLSKQLILTPKATFGHEMFMVLAALAGDDDDSLRNSHNKVLQDWWKLYGHSLSIALTDTFGSEFFFSDMTAEQARQWIGLRQDSGDPFVFGERALEFYRDAGLSYDEIKDKLIVFSDGLELQKILDLSKRFEGRIKTSFGWGTNLTNDLGFPAMSLVVKAVSADGRPTVKLSDNIAKAMGTKEDITRYARVFGYANTQSVVCKY